MSKKLLLNVVPQTSPEATGTFIFLHGSNDTGDGFRNWIRHVLGYELTFPHIKIIYPTGPEQPYRFNNGKITPTWYDLFEITIKEVEDEQTIDASCELIKDLISQEIANGIPINRIILGGFSMGGNLALHVVYRCQLKLAGCITLSSYLYEDSVIYKALKSQKDKNITPLLMCHGERDRVVKYKWGDSAFTTLKDLGVDVKFHSYLNLMHEIEKSELEMIKEWIKKKIPEFE